MCTQLAVTEEFIEVEAAENSFPQYQIHPLVPLSSDGLTLRVALEKANTRIKLLEEFVSVLEEEIVGAKEAEAVLRGEYKELSQKYSEEQEKVFMLMERYSILQVQLKYLTSELVVAEDEDDDMVGGDRSMDSKEGLESEHESSGVEIVIDFDAETHRLKSDPDVPGLSQQELSIPVPSQSPGPLSSNNEDIAYRDGRPRRLCDSLPSSPVVLSPDKLQGMGDQERRSEGGSHDGEASEGGRSNVAAVASPVIVASTNRALSATNSVNDIIEVRRDTFDSTALQRDVKQLLAALRVEHRKSDVDVSLGEMTRTLPLPAEEATTSANSDTIENGFRRGEDAEGR